MTSSQSPQGLAVLVSGTGAPLIVDTNSQGSQWKDVELNCNKVGTVGYYGAIGGATTFNNVHAHDC